MARRLRALAEQLLSVLVRYVPDCQPVVFDQDRTDDFNRMCEAATSWPAPVEIGA